MDSSTGEHRLSCSNGSSSGSSAVLERAKRQHIDTLRSRIENLNSKTPEDQDVLLFKDESSGLARICIKSGAKNALSGRMISKLTEVIDQLYAWPEGRGVLIEGYGNTFCSGSDLVCVRATASQEAGLELAQIMQYNMMRLQQLPMVSVAWLEGYALGGGAELSTAADLRLMSGSARIGFVHVKVGVCCGWGGGSRLVQLVGPSRALDLLASGRTIKADEALQFGLCNAIVSSQQEALEYLKRRTIGASHTLSALKSMVNSARLLPFADSLQIEGHLFASTWGTDVHVKALESNIKHN